VVEMRKAIQGLPDGESRGRRVMGELIHLTALPNASHYSQGRLECQQLCSAGRSLERRP